MSPSGNPPEMPQEESGVPDYHDSNLESTQPDPPTMEPAAAPALESVKEFLLFGLSLPERAIRSTTAMVSGAVIESAAILLPQAFRSSKTYTTFVEQMLDFMAHDIGRVDRVSNTSTPEVENYVAKKTVGSFIELAALPLLHVSPMTVLAIVSDVAYGSQTYLQELSDELKTQGVIDQDSTIDHATDLLDALKKTTATAADALDKPPLSIDGLAETIEQVTKASEDTDVTEAIPRREIERLWQDMHRLATDEDKSILEISSAMSMYAMNRVGNLGQGALSTISVAGNMFDQHILEHYREGITELHRQGYYAFLSESSRPYISAVWKNFSDDQDTITEDILSGRMLGRTWKAVSSWFQGAGDEKEKQETSGERASHPTEPDVESPPPTRPDARPDARPDDGSPGNHCG